MGIKELWTILTPFCERRPLYELQGKIVAVDLAGWICEAQNVLEYSVQPRMYLRNLYFRTCYLLLMDVTPVFVLEGKAPTLKYQTIADRNALQFKGSKPKSDKVKTGKDRTRFHFVLKQCADMLRFMGVTCITGTGEAESMCAYLNEDDLVAGCISQDSDCFAYGANVVYRNFSISHQGSYAAAGGAVDVYDIRKANKTIRFGRNKIVALALLCGSDYNDGVFGVGKDSAIKFLDRYDDADILERMKSWRNDSATFNSMEIKIGNKNICTSCGHFGKVQMHTKNGCVECKTTKGCDFSKYREERLEIKNELQIRSKAMADPNFPDENLINEYLIRKDNVKQLNLKWKQPDLVNFVIFTNKLLTWEEIYAFEKFLPILTRWQIFNYEYVMRNSSSIKGILYPSFIKKKRNPKGVQSYEIIWEDRDKYFDSLIPENQLDEFKTNNSGSLDGLWSTIEPQNLIDKAYPDLVEAFLEKKNKGKTKKPTKRKNQPKEPNENDPPAAPKPRKAKKTTKTKKQIEECADIPTFPQKSTTLDNYIQQNGAIEHACISSDDDDCDLSLIIDNMVMNKPALPEKIAKLGYFIEDVRDAFNESNLHENSFANGECSFFVSNLEEEDLFEKTFNEKIKDSSDSDIENLSAEAELDKFTESNDTQIYEIDEDIERYTLGVGDEIGTKSIGNESMNDTFDVEFVPLYERLKKKKL